MSKHSRTLFIGDISVFCSEIDIYDFFRNFGPIEEVKLMKGKNNSPMGYAFLTFAELVSAQQALITDGAVFMGRAIKVSPAFHRNQHIPTTPVIFQQQDPTPKSFVNTPHLMHKSRSPSESSKTAQVHFSFISQNIMFPVNEFTVKSVFSRFGPVLEVCFKKSVAHKESGGQSGYGFIHFPLTSEGIAAAVEVAKNIRQVIIEHVLYDCCLSHELETFLKKVSSTFQQLPEPPKIQNTTPTMVSSSVSSSSSSLGSSLGSPTISSTPSNGQQYFHNKQSNRFQEFEMTKEFSIFGENSSFYFNRDGYSSY